MEKESLIKSLSEGVAKVTFLKKDGTYREMVCTRNPSLISAEHQPKNEKEIKENEDCIKVFDIEKQGWRSFNFSSVKEVNYGTNQ